MKTIILILIIASGHWISAQSTHPLLQKHVLGHGTDFPTSLSFDAYPFLFLSDGYGGSLGIEFGHFQAGLIGFAVQPPEFIIKTFFDNSSAIEIPHNSAVEGFFRYYLRPDRKWTYLGLLGGPEWFTVRDVETGAEERLIKSYVVPVIGLRWFPFQEYLYVDPSFGYSVYISGTETRALGNAIYNASRGGLIYFLQLGLRVNLSPRTVR